MRIAVSGSHATGKSTLVRELIHRFPGVTAVDEPYYLLVDEGHAFSDPPTIDDFELLFDRAVSSMIGTRSVSLIFDRSPADYLAYLAALGPGEALTEHVLAATAALSTLDGIVYVPIERPDRIQAAEASRLRRRVDALLRDMLMSDAWGFAVPVVEVRGSPSERVSQIAGSLGTSQASGAAG